MTSIYFESMSDSGRRIFHDVDLIQFLVTNWKSGNSQDKKMEEGVINLLNTSILDTSNYFGSLYSSAKRSRTQ